MTVHANYKAIIHCHLGGGPDAHFPMQPYDLATWNLFNGARPALMTPRANLLATVLTPLTPLPNSKEYAMHPNMAPLLPIWNAGNAAFVLNCGVLRQPTSKAQYAAGTNPLLFDHAGQTIEKQALANTGASHGWLGRIADIVKGQNSNPQWTSLTINDLAVATTPITINQLGLSVNGYQSLLGNSTQLNGSTVANTQLRSIMSTSQPGLIADAHADTAASAFAAYTAGNATLAASPTIPATTYFAAGNAGNHINNSLARQLGIILRKASMSQEFGVQKEVFHISLGGFDHHSNLAVALAGLLDSVSKAISFFTEVAASFSLTNRMVLCVAGEFGRTWAQNGSSPEGTDHGWGTHHWLFGGPVVGQQFYGTDPVFDANSMTNTGGPDDVGQGRLLPTTAVDEYAYDICRWFGLSDAEAKTVLPNFVNFEAKPRLNVVV
jgi:uncharacterized protein (DUF1501 family)